MGPLDAALLTAALLGGLAGAVAGLVPGIHVNTLASAGLALTLAGLAPSGPVVPFLFAALGAQTFTSVVPLVLLGVPEGEDAPGLLPGQRLAARGRARHALHASATGSLVGLVVGAGAAVLLAGVLAAPQADTWLGRATPVVALLAIAVLVRTDPAGPVRALAVVGLAGVLGHGALALPVRSPVGLPASVLLPLFLGLFALPALADARRAAPPARTVQRRPLWVRTPVVGPLLGASLGLVAGLFAGFTAGPATAVATLVRRGDDEEVLATTSAVNTSAACIATAVLFATGRSRTGVHAAASALGARPVTMDGLALDLAAIATGALVGLALLAVAARAADGLARTVPRLAALLVPVWALLVVLFTGWSGALVLACGWSLARTARTMGTRRSLLMAVLLVPALLRGWGG